MQQEQQQPSTEQWAIVELFGHTRIAGRISEHTIGGSSFVRIDVPELPRDDGQGFGAKKGYVDFGGYLTNSSTYVTAWSDAQITVKVPSNAIPGCLRVYVPTGGWSNCKMMN